MRYRIQRRSFLGALGGAALAQDSQQPGGKPNLLLILTDQQTHTALSCAGNPWLKTPAMDSLAARGRRFAEAYCNYPVCSPSRSTVFTSRMPHQTGVRVNGRPIAAGMATMGDTFRAAGYDTVYGGKWHLPRSFDGMTGFTKLIGGSSQGKDMDTPLANTCSEWIRTNPKGPFLMVASFMNPHDICEWIRQHRGAREYPNPDVFPPAPGNMAHDPSEPECMAYHRSAGYDSMSQAVGIASEWKPFDVRFYLHDYYRMVEAVDAEIAKLLAALRETGLDRNTLIAFASDHGEGMGAHRWVQKAAFYEESAHVPLIFSGPAILQPGAVDRHNLTSLADIFPTFCDYAGLAAPKDAVGKTLRPALEGHHRLERDFIVSELRYAEPGREGRMLRTARHKYVVFASGARREQFFDLQTDPGETFNLAQRPDGAPRLDEHRGLLKKWISATGDDFRVI